MIKPVDSPFPILVSPLHNLQSPNDIIFFYLDEKKKKKKMSTNINDHGFQSQ